MEENINKTPKKRITLRKIGMLIICIVIISNIVFIPVKTFAATKYTQTLKSGIENFPKEYQEQLKKIKEQHPNWSFEAYYTGITWNELLANETNHGHNRVIKTADDTWKCSCGNIQSGYACASAGITAYYLDPRNFLDDVSIFQFLEISYNPNVHKLEGVEKSVKNTFLDNVVTLKIDGKEKKMSYAEIILEAAKQTNMSPYSIRTKIIQEVGTKGSSSVTGTYPGYEGYYNFFNYGAYDEGNAIVNALEYAKKAGWDNQYTAIIEGAKLLANSYTNAGQNTAYFYKWDVVGNKILETGKSQTFTDTSYFFKHQYMTNVQDPKSQSKTLFNMYASIGILNEKLNFIIPVYDSMPKTPAEIPTNIVSNNDTLIYYVTDSDGINVRKEPSTSSEKICAIAKNTKVVVLEKDCAKANGYTWYKIQLSNGTVGYVASNYIAYYSGKEINSNTNAGNSTVTEKPKEPEQPKVDETKVKIDTKKLTITTIPTATAKDIIDNAGIKNYTVTDAKGNKIEKTALVGTGYKIINNDNKQAYTIIKLGDANGDGTADAVDMLLIKRKLLNMYKIEGNYISATDLNKDNSLDAVDMLLLKRFLLGTQNIKL